MSNLTFNGNQAWFVTPDSKYGLSLFPAKKLTDEDFSFLAKIKVDWNTMNPNDNTKEAGVIIKNGLHMGLSVVRPNETDCYLKATIWTSDIIPDNDVTNLWEVYSKSTLKNFDILVKVNWEADDFVKEYEVGFSFRRKEKEFSVYCNGTWNTEKYDGELLDYSNAWLWVGCSNPLESCPEDFRQFFKGEVSRLAVFTKALDRDEIFEVYQNFTNISKRLKPICAFDFETQTPYKVLDITNNGNNLVKFDKEWMDSI